MFSLTHTIPMVEAQQVKAHRALSYFNLSSWDLSIVSGEKEYKTLPQHT